MATAKDILDKYATAVLRKTAVFTKEGRAIVNSKKIEDYNPNKYSEGIVLWIPPKDCIRLEFEQKGENKHINKKYIREIEQSCKSLNIEYCVSDHEGGTSPYINIWNLKSIPLNEDNKLAKYLLIDLLLSEEAKKFLDRTNLGQTWSPVFEHPHWKPKYKGAIHKIVRGINPLEQKNEYPKELLKKIKTAKKIIKNSTLKLKETHSKWTEDFLLNFCLNNKLPEGERHTIIEKNLASLILHRKDREGLIAQWMKVQETKHLSIRTWFSAIIQGRFTEVSPNELKTYIKNNNLDYEIPEEVIQTKPLDIKVPDKELQILKDPKFLSKLIKETQRKVTKEADTIEALFIILNGRNVENKHPTSDNILVNDETGTGKDFISSCVFEFIPDDEKIEKKRVSPKALVYLKNRKFDPTATWNKIALRLEDPSNQVLNDDSFKVLVSNKGIFNMTIIKDGKPEDYAIENKPSICITMAHPEIKDEGLRRFPGVGLDDTIDQSQEIIKKQAKAKQTGKTIIYNPDFKKALGYLKRVKVIIPFAMKLTKVLPYENIIIRTKFNHFLDYISFSASLHQYQREKNNAGFIIATQKDYEIGRRVFLKTISNRYLVPMTKDQKNIVGIFKKLGADKRYSLADLSNYFPVEDRQLMRRLDKLVNLKILTRGKEKRYDEKGEAIRKPVIVWKLTLGVDISIPSFKDLQKHDKSDITANKTNKTNTTNITNNNIIKQRNTKNNKSDLSQMSYLQASSNPRNQEKKVINPTKSLKKEIFSHLKKIEFTRQNCFLCKKQWNCNFTLDNEYVCNDCIEDLKSGDISKFLSEFEFDTNEVKS